MNVSPSRRHARKPTPSIPLPLPTRFALLPSRLPGTTLTPLLYTFINSTPVYLTLSPSHEPHLSLLPLLLSLEPPISPLHVLTSCKLRPGDYSLEINGVAPYVDLWIPFERAKEICEYLGVARLFWDERDKMKGLLGEEVKGAVSWDESRAVGHNWLPPLNNLPPSSYSLSALLETSFASISIISDDRCITTPLDKEMKARLLDRAVSEDHSSIRQRHWRTAWDSLLAWTVEMLNSKLRAWEMYLQHPSQPVASSSKQPDHPAHSLLNTMPSLLGQSAPSYSPSSQDLASVLDPDTQPAPLTIFGMVYFLVQHLNPFHHDPPPNLFELEHRARVNIGLVESVGLTLVGMWHAQATIERIKSDDLLPRVIIECSHGHIHDSLRASEVVHLDGGAKVSPADSDAESIDELEERRRSSPPRMYRRRRRKIRSPQRQRQRPRNRIGIGESIDIGRLVAEPTKAMHDLLGGGEDELDPNEHVSPRSERELNGNVVSKPHEYEPTMDDNESELQERHLPQDQSSRTSSITRDGDEFPWDQADDSDGRVAPVAELRHDEDVSISPPRAQSNDGPGEAHAHRHDLFRTEVVKTARLPWWIIGSAITIPALAFILLRSNRETVRSTYDNSRILFEYVWLLSERLWQWAVLYSGRVWTWLVLIWGYVRVYGSKLWEERQDMMEAVSRMYRRVRGGS